MMAISTCRWHLLLFLLFFHAPQLDYHGNIYYPVFLHTVPMVATDISFFLKLFCISSCTSTVLICPPWISLGLEARRLRTSLLFLRGLSTLSRLCLPQTRLLTPHMENCRLVLVSLSTRHAYNLACGNRLWFIRDDYLYYPWLSEYYIHVSLHMATLFHLC